MNQLWKVGAGLLALVIGNGWSIWSLHWLGADYLKLFIKGENVSRLTHPKPGAWMYFLIVGLVPWWSTSFRALTSVVRAPLVPSHRAGISLILTTIAVFGAVPHVHFHWIVPLVTGIFLLPLRYKLEPIDATLVCLVQVTLLSFVIWATTRGIGQGPVGIAALSLCLVGSAIAIARSNPGILVASWWGALVVFAFLWLPGAQSFQAFYRSNLHRGAVAVIPGYRREVDPLYSFEVESGSPPLPLPLRVTGFRARGPRLFLRIGNCWRSEIG